MDEYKEENNRQDLHLKTESGGKLSAIIHYSRQQ
jgi:hypothetical protein